MFFLLLLGIIIIIYIAINLIEVIGIIIILINII